MVTQLLDQAEPPALRGRLRCQGRRRGATPPGGRGGGAGAAAPGGGHAGAAAGAAAAGGAADQHETWTPQLGDQGGEPTREVDGEMNRVKPGKCGLGGGWGTRKKEAEGTIG